jgi:hypothetical protein
LRYRASRSPVKRWPWTGLGSISHLTPTSVLQQGLRHPYGCGSSFDDCSPGGLEERKDQEGVQREVIALMRNVIFWQCNVIFWQPGRGGASLPGPHHLTGEDFKLGQKVSAHTASLQSLGHGEVCTGRGSNKGGHAESRQCRSPGSPLAEGIYPWIWDGGLLGLSPRGTQPDGGHRRFHGWIQTANWLARGWSRPSRQGSAIGLPQRVAPSLEGDGNREC